MDDNYDLFAPDYFAQVSSYNNKILLSVGGGEYDCQMDVVLDRDYIINLINDLQHILNNVSPNKIILTRELIYAGASPPAGFNNKQVALFGLKYPLKHGWIDRLVGTEIDSNVYENFLNLKGQNKKMIKKTNYELEQAELESKEYSEFIRKTLY